MIEFTFSRDWTHAGVTYAKGNKATLGLSAANKLKTLGAGSFDTQRPAASETPAKR